MIAFIQELENNLVANLGWPLWALKSIEILVLAVIVVFLVQIFIVEEEALSKTPSKVTVSFRIFQFQYLSVYLIIMLADWLQGTNM